MYIVTLSHTGLSWDYLLRWLRLRCYVSRPQIKSFIQSINQSSLSLFEKKTLLTQTQEGCTVELKK